MTLDERIESIRYWLGEFEAENCGYKEFAINMAEDMPVILAELARKDAMIDVLAQHMVDNIADIGCLVCPCDEDTCDPESWDDDKDCRTSIYEWAITEVERKT